MRTFTKLNTLLTISLLMVSIVCMGQRSGGSTKAPDFAYPKTVSENAVKELDKALQTGNSSAVVRSLLDYTLAQMSIGSDNMPTSIGRIDSVRSIVSDTTLRAMLDMLEAEIYNNIYSASRWKYDRRTSSQLLPLPTDYTEWTGEQFRHKIDSLTDSALADSTRLKQIPITDYKGVLTLQDKMTVIYYPTLYSFVVNRAISIMSGRGDTDYDKVLRLYDSVISSSPRLSAQGVNARIGRLSYAINNNPDNRVYSSDGYRVEPFMRLYESYLRTDGTPATEYAGDILLEIPTYGAERKWLYNAIKGFMKAYPAYWRNDCLLRKLNTMEQKQVNLTAPAVTGMGREMKFDIAVTNVDRLTIDIYDVSSSPVINEDYIYTTGMAGVRKTASIPVKITGESIPFDTTVQASYTFEAQGNYIAVPVVPGHALRKENFRKIHVTSIALGASYFLDRTLWAVDAVSGEPLQDVALGINSNPYSKKSVTKKLGLTDINGAIDITNQHGSVTAQKGDDRYAMPLYIYNYNYERPDKWVMEAAGYSSLPLYHPGDTASWAAVCYEYKGGLNRPYGGKEVKAVLYDANSIPVDTMDVVTDRYGRASGSFALPKDGLTGHFRIAIDNCMNAVSFEISDYKLPTFRALTPTVERDTPTTGCVTIRGLAETYTGFPIGDAEVTLTLSVAERPRWWYPSQSYDIYTAKTHTAADGRYEIIIGADTFKESPVKNGFYTVGITVLSSTGETQTASTSFGSGERYMIKASLPDNFDITKGQMPVEVKVVNYEDSTVNGAVDVAVMSGDTVTTANLYIDGKNTIDVSTYKQGVYKIRFARENADTVTREVTLYNPEAKDSPIKGELLWAPAWSIGTDADGSGSWLYATDCDTYVLASIWTPDTLISRKWVKTAKGFNRMAVNLPPGVDKATLSVMATGNYRQTSGTVNIKRTDLSNSLKITTETFRDKIVPGQEEIWIFRITTTDGTGREAAVIADMYNTALDALAMSDWGLHLRSGSQPRLRNILSNLSTTFGNYINIPVKPPHRLNCKNPASPDFNTYGMPFGSYLTGGIRVRNQMMSKQAAYDAVTEDAVVEEMTTGMLYDAGVGAESAVADETAIEGETEAEDVAKSEMKNFDYRDSNVPLAFFRPTLVTEPDGRLELKFTVPNANTTWGFRALAFTDSLLSATFAKNVVASKEIMVQPNLPRYLRTADEAIIKASVMNATDDTQHISTLIELFNPSDGKVISSLKTTDTVAATGNATVDMTVKVPADMTILGYRIKSSTETFADGEQALIPILPSVTPVIETTPFYIAPSQHEFQMRLSKISGKGSATLQLCENPIWYVATALPGLLDNGAGTAPDAARAIFSAAAAYGIINNNPAIAEALKEWADSDKSAGKLTSMLEQNEELKIILLNATPWMLDAKNDTERMTRLSLLFDKKTVNKALDKNIELLDKLSCDGGGWCWSGSYHSYSQWATRSVLTQLGRLTSLGFLPENARLRRMLKDALSRDTDMTLKDFRKYPDGDYADYVRIHDLFASLGYGHADECIVNATTQKILKGWKESSLARKAVDAQILYNHGYRNTAPQILSSIRQFGDNTPEKGMWFPSLNEAWYGTMDKVGITALILETFNLIEPGCADIDNLRQWLILQKGTQNWGTSSTATDVIAAILTTSHKWIAPAEVMEMKLNNKKAATENYERLTGECEITLPAKEVSGKQLTVTKKADTPAWGAVYYRYTGEMTGIEPSSCPELSIVKSMPDTLAVGDRVTVRLTLKADIDMDYVVITDDRPACLEPVEQLPSPIFAEGLYFYRENRDASTRIFIDRLPKGTYILTYDLWANNAGTYTSGIASVQSEYAPRYSAHSGGGAITVNPR